MLILTEWVKKSQPLFPYKKWGFAVLRRFLSALLFCISLKTSWVAKPKYVRKSGWLKSCGSRGFWFCSESELSERTSGDSSEYELADAFRWILKLHTISQI